MKTEVEDFFGSTLCEFGYNVINDCLEEALKISTKSMKITQKDVVGFAVYRQPACRFHNFPCMQKTQEIKNLNI